MSSWRWRIGWGFHWGGWLTSPQTQTNACSHKQTINSEHLRHLHSFLQVLCTGGTGPWHWCEWVIVSKGCIDAVQLAPCLEPHTFPSCNSGHAVHSGAVLDPVTVWPQLLGNAGTQTESRHWALGERPDKGIPFPHNAVILFTDWYLCYMKALCKGSRLKFGPCLSWESIEIKLFVQNS